MQKVIVFLLCLMLVFTFVGTNYQIFINTTKEATVAHNSVEVADTPNSDYTNSAKSGKPFVLSAATRPWFDRFISEDDSHNRSKLLADFEQQLSDYSKQAAAVLMDLFSRYVDYKIKLVDLDSDKPELTHHIGEVEKRLLLLENLRSQFFTNREIEVFFGVDKIIDKSALQRFEIIHDETLSRKQKRELIASNLASMPEQEKVGLQPSLNLIKLKDLKKLNTDKQAYLANVAAEFGDEVALRYEKLHDHQTKWKNTIDNVVAKKQWMLEQSNSKSEFNDRFEKYLENHFTPNQIKRIKVNLKFGNVD